MACASNRLYEEVIRRKMARLASDVKAKELMLHLSCLTLTDREEIEAKRETVGNYNAIVLLIDNLRRRENWPDQLINALRNCEQQALAAEFQDAYDRIRGINTSAAVVLVPAAAATVNPEASPTPIMADAALPLAPTPEAADASATVITATVHSAPHVIPSLLTQREASDESPALVEPFLSSSEYKQISTASQFPVVSEENNVEVMGPTGNQNTLSKDSQNTLTSNQHLEGTHTEVPAKCQTEPPSPCVATEVKEDFSKPGTLREEESVSVSSDDLKISHVITETEHPAPPTSMEQTMSVPVSNTQVANEPFEKLNIYSTEHVSDHIPCENAVEISTPEVSSNLSNDIPDGEKPFSNHPVENNCESISESLQTDTSRFSGISSVENLNGQPLSAIGNAAQKNKESAELNNHSESHSQSGDPEIQPSQNNQGIINSSPLQRTKESQAVLSRFQSDPRFIAAAAFGVTAVFVAWKFK